ncbi:MAG: carboxypeptidase-like regulatory domain-containing protein [Acidobacteriota bacterium]|nr:carboxypeptidase-like regulatory domain-containing protein [Acidobacteriota bacterium]
MNSVQLRSIVAASLVATILAVPAFAQRRRAVAHPAATGEFLVTITGTVLDDVTGLPIRNATVSADFSGVTDATGKFRLRNVTGYGLIEVKVERSGYVATSRTLKAGDSPDLNFRLTPTQTVSLRRTNGTTVALDIESVRFGHSVPFSGHVKIQELCKADGTHVPIDFTQISRVGGPGVVVSSGGCCTKDVAKIPLTLKSGETFDGYFIDSCGDSLKPDFSGREHVSGVFAFIAITDIAEIVFP